jgi:arsenate reductase
VKKAKRVLFVCIGNSCRSQMAEAFARAYGRDVIKPSSAGVYPATIIAPDTKRAMAEKNLDLKGQHPKNVDEMELSKFDLIVDMSGGYLEGLKKTPVEVWDVPDPIALDYDEHCKVRDRIELLVKQLIRELGAGKPFARVFSIGL